jgi:STE24 endopeptidase
MTATRIGRRRLFVAAVGLACAAAWVAAAAWLWRTTVPALHLTGFDERRYFTAPELSRAHRFAAGESAIWILGELATLAALAILTIRMPKIVRGIALGRVSTAIVVGMVIFVTLWFVALPFGIAELWWQHHWGLGPFDVGAWLLEERIALPATAVSWLTAIAIAVGLATRFPRNWWIPAAPAFIAIVVLFGFLYGWLGAVGSHPVRDASLRARIARIERVEHATAPVRVLPMHDVTHQANAFAAGFGPSTRVVLWDTLLDHPFTRGQVDVVVAHELGHVKSRHVMKGLAWFALIAFPSAFLVAVVTRRGNRGGLRNPATLPLALLVLAVVGLLTAPLQNAVSRRYEAEADWRALQATHDPASARKLFQNFGRTSLAEPNPPLLDYLWLETHPTLMQRIAMAEQYRAGH